MVLTYDRGSPVVVDDNDIDMTDVSTKVVAPGQARLERLPLELQTQIMGLCRIDTPADGTHIRNPDMTALLYTSRTIHVATVNVLYEQVTVPGPQVFRKFFAQIKSRPDLAAKVRRLDFSQYSRMRCVVDEGPTITSTTLYECLCLLSGLQEFLGNEHMAHLLDRVVCRKLLFGLPRLFALDLSGCNTDKLSLALELALKDASPGKPTTIQRLSLHRCYMLKPEVFEGLMPRLRHLTRLDITRAKITSEALLSIPKTAQLTHLNLDLCRRLESSSVVDFIANHPAVASSLTWLSLDCITEDDDLSTLLDNLPIHLSSFFLKGHKLSGSHVRQLEPYIAQLEELSLSADLEKQDLFPCLRRSANPHALGKPDLVDAINATPRNLRYLDLSEVPREDLAVLLNDDRGAALLSGTSSAKHLEAIEVSEDVGRYISDKKWSRLPEHWEIVQTGSRWRLERRQPHNSAVMEGQGLGSILVETDGNGGRRRRDSKTGGKTTAMTQASLWGMRKVPMAKVVEAGGMYKHYMYGQV